MCVRAVFICVRNMSVCLRSVLWDRLCLRADSPSRFGNLSLVMRRLFTEMRVTDKGSETSHTLIVEVTLLFIQLFLEKLSECVRRSERAWRA